MRLTTFDRLHQLTLMPRLFPVNCYVFEEEEGLILIDAALKWRQTRSSNLPVKRTNQFIRLFSLIAIWIISAH